MLFPKHKVPYVLISITFAPIYLIISVLWVARRTFILTAIALDDQLTLAESRKLAKGHTWKILLAPVIISIAVAIPMWFIASFVEVLGIAATVIISVAQDILVSLVGMTFIALLYKNVIAQNYMQQQASENPAPAATINNPQS